MKHIKYFESSETDYSKYTCDIEDVLQDLVDDGFSVNIEKDYKNGPCSITIINNDPFRLYDIYDYILTVRDVIDSSNFFKTYYMIRVADTLRQINGYESPGSWIGLNLNLANDIYDEAGVEAWRKYYKIDTDKIYGVYMVISPPEGNYYRLSFDNKTKNGFRTYEAYTHRDIDYEYEWCLPNSPLRLKIERDLRDILLEATDLGCSVSTGWIREPYVWIGTKFSPSLQRSSKPNRFNYSDLDDVIERVKHYLTIEGMVITHTSELKNQIYIYFNKSGLQPEQLSF